MAITITSIHYVYPRRDGQAELVWVVWLNIETIYPRTVTHLSTNLARRSVTSLMSPTMLPLSQTVTLRSQTAGKLKITLLERAARERVPNENDLALTNCRVGRNCHNSLRPSLSLHTSTVVSITSAANTQAAKPACVCRTALICINYANTCTRAVIILTDVYKFYEQRVM